MLSKLNKVYINYRIKKAIEMGFQLGEGSVFLGVPNLGSEPYLIRIGNKCTVTSGVRFVTHDGGTRVFRNNEKYKSVKKYGKIEIGDNSFIGINSIIMPDVTIGQNCIIGAGAVVTKSIPNDSVAVGNPAKVIMSLETYMDKCAQNSTPIKNNGPKKREELIKYFWG